LVGHKKQGIALCRESGKCVPGVPYFLDVIFLLPIEQVVPVEAGKLNSMSFVENNG
jgi:hypothetical protein